MDRDQNVVEFSVGKVRLTNDGRDHQKATFYVQNRCSASRKIRAAVAKHSDPVFKLLSGYEERYLAAGLKLPVVLQYCPEEEGVANTGELSVFVEEKLTISIPIEALPPSPLLEISTQSILFDGLVAEHQIVSQHFSITNAGTKEGAFLISAAALPALFIVSPLEGNLEPKETTNIKVELLCKETGSFSGTIRVWSGEEQSTVTVAGHVQARRLQLLDPTGPSVPTLDQCPLDRVFFGPAYYGTVLSRKALLFNNSPVATDYLAVLDGQAEGSEHGVDKSEGLALACTAGGLGQSKWREQGYPPSSESLVNVSPAQGSLAPYEKRLVEFTFSPRVHPSEEGWTHHQGLPTQRDYTLFVNFITVGAQSTLMCSSGQDPLEVAVTGRAVPVDLSVLPGPTLDFGDCTVGHCTTQEIQLYNRSDVLPLDFSSRLLAHYKCDPAIGRIPPGQIQILSVLFQPRQLGELNFKLMLDTLGRQGPQGGGDARKGSTGSSRTSRYGVVHTAVVDLRGNGVTKRDGIRSGERGDTVHVAHPDERATSIRPHDGNRVTVTPYTRVRRHTYVDPDYTYSEEERARVREHRDSYAAFIRTRHSERMWRERESTHSDPTYRNDQELGMAPAQGLLPPRLADPQARGRGRRRRRKAPPTQTHYKEEGKMLTSRDLLTATTLKLHHVEQCARKPPNPEVASECRTVLSPEQLSQVHFDPVIVDFGQVVLGCAGEELVSLKNFLSTHISVKLKVIGEEVLCGPQTPSPSPSPLFIILPPHSYTEVPFSLQLNGLGVLERSVEYCINHHHCYHLPVKADVARLSLSLSTTTLTLSQPPLATPTAGLRGSVLVSNEHNAPANFQWLARQEVDTNVLYMMHPRGTVPPFGFLECEFVCQPSYFSPESAQFMLTVEDQKEEETPSSNVLTLITKFGKPSCSFREKRVLFGAVPLNLLTTQTVHLENTGDCHAHFQIMDPTPYPGVRVIPTSGCVPVGGATELQVILQAESVDKFDVTLRVALRGGGRSLSLRLAGAVEQPIISIDKELFRFGGVFCGARATAPFTLTNKSSTHAQLVFDFSYLSDFSLGLPKQDSSSGGVEVKCESSSSDYPGIYTVEVPGKTTARCTLEFCPKDIAAYDFHLPVLVNGLRPSSPPPSPWPPSHLPSKISVVPAHKGSSTSFDSTPSRRVLATALRAPLEVSSTDVNVVMPSGYLDTTREPVLHPQGIQLTNTSEEAVTWSLDYQGLRRVEDGTFRFVLPSGTPFSPLEPSSPTPRPGDVGYLAPGKSFQFSLLCGPAHHGTFTASVPLIVNRNTAQPYRLLELSSEVLPGRISVNPTHIVVQPVPLMVSLTAQFFVTVQQFAKPVDLEVSLPPMESHVSFSVRFPEGSRVQDCRQGPMDLPCILEFSSSQPISLTDFVEISDSNTGKRKRVPFTVAADNTVFTIYEFIALNLTNASIHNDNVTGSPNLLLHGHGGGRGGMDSSTSLSSARSGGEDGGAMASLTGSTSSFGEMFLQDCVSAVCRWLSMFGWSEGVRCVSVPTEVRKRVGHDIPKAGVKQRSIISSSRGILVDLFTHLCGRVPPGVPINPPPCTTSSEKVHQQYSTYSTLLAFIRNQGGLMWSVVPESLLAYQDWQQWSKEGGGGKGSSSLFQPSSEEEFNDLSKQAWTHLLMQVIKVLVLPRATAHVPKPLRETDKAMLPLSSNVYSQPERRLLAWLNYHYQQQRNTVFGAEADLLEREVVNFDVDLMDCTVLACVLTAYCPYLVSSYFSRLYPEPGSPEQCSHNSIVFVEALHHLGIDYDCQPNDLCSPNPVMMILFCAYLYRRLPAFIPRTTISFEGTLHNTVVQQVRLENPSGKALVYRALLTGDNAGEFSLSLPADSLITVPRQKSTAVDVRYQGRHTHPCSATLLLVDTGGRAIAGTTLAFRLQGSISGAKAQASVTVTAPLYEPQAITLEATNHFEQDGEFEIKLFETADRSLLFPSVMKTKYVKLRRKNSPKAPTLIPTSAFQDRTTDRMQLFNSSVTTVRLEPGKKAQFSVQFVPIKMESRYCTLVLSNRDIGEIVLSITAVVKLPYPLVPQASLVDPHTIVNEQTKTVHLKAHSGQSVQEEIVIPSKNLAFERAVLEISKWGMSKTELKRRTLSESFQCAAISTAVAMLGLDDKPKSYTDSLTQGMADQIVFKVEGGNEFFTFPEAVLVPAQQRGSAVLPVTFVAEEAGQYESHVVLKSEHDVRVVVIESTVMAHGRHAELEFHTTAMLPLMQEIPLVNPSTVEWPLQAVVTGSGFTGPEFLLANALATTSYPLTFNPRKEGIVEGDIHLVNMNDGSEHVFHLRGVADRPLAQEHIVLQAQAKKSLTHILHVPNYNERTTVFKVESDMESVSGDTSLSIGGGDVVDYPLTILPKRQGVFTGAVAFVAQAVSRPHSGFDERLNATTSAVTSPHHMWFQLECHVDPAPPDHVIPVSCPTLSSTTTHLTVVNPHPQPLTLEVLVEGDGLSGPSCLVLESCGEAIYPLTYSPSRAGKNTGRVVFNGSPEGEFWYQLNLKALDPKPVAVPDVKCQLGRSCQQLLELRNPLNEPVLFSCQCTNTKHFTVTSLTDGQVRVDPQSAVEVQILFSPSALGVGKHETAVSFTSEQFGTQVFILRGEGLEPATMDPTTVSASLSSNTMHVFNFTNPLDSSSYFSVSLQGNDSDHFCLLMKTTRVLLHPGASLDVPVMFAPESMHMHQITVAITTEAQDTALSWLYPVIGQPELRPFSPSSAPRLTCRAKERLEQRLEVSLVASTTSQAVYIRPANPGTPTSLATEDKYSYKLTCSDRRFASLVEHSTGIKLLGRKCDKENKDMVTLAFSIVFVPPKAFSCAAELHVTNNLGGVWKFPLLLSATTAAPDDVITIEGEGLNVTTQVGFRLTTMLKHPAPFTANLTLGSDPEITVHPTNGELAPVNTRGTLFCVTYKPTTYGRDHHANLVVQCESAEWCYEIVGKPPSYSSPTAVSPRIQHRATLPLRIPHTRRNFVRENVKLTSNRV